MSDSPELTAKGSGYYVVYRNGVKISQHLAEREAIEKAVALETENPADKISYKHDYEVDVEMFDELAGGVTPTPSAPPVGAFNYVIGSHLANTPDIDYPAIGVPFTDPNYFTELTRVSDAQDNTEQFTFMRNDYSRRTSINADNTKIALNGNAGHWYMYDLTNLAADPVDISLYTNGPAGDSGLEWDATDPDKYWFHAGVGSGLALLSMDVSTGAVTVEADLTSVNSVNGNNAQGSLLDKFPDATHFWDRNEGRWSDDYEYYFGIAEKYVGNNPELIGYALYKRSTNVIVWAMTAAELGNVDGNPLPTGRPDNVTITPDGKFVHIQAVSGLTGSYIFDALAPLTDSARLTSNNTHADFCMGSDGDAYLVIGMYSNETVGVNENGKIMAINCRTRARTFTGISGIDGSGVVNNSFFSEHISGCHKSIAMRDHCLVSGYNNTKPTPPEGPFQRKNFILNFMTGEVYNVCHNHHFQGTAVIPYFYEPHACFSNDGTKFACNMSWDEGNGDGETIEAFVGDIHPEAFV